jgi:serine/threonine-protein kinase
MSEVMTAAEQWRRVQDLCDALEGVPDAEIAGRLDALESDTAVRCEVLAILAALRDEATFPPASPRPPLVAAQPTEIGGVRIASRLGAGGSGEVFRGVRVVNGVEQPVAVKRFHAHRATASDLGRFAREQRLLAGLTHPDIVRLFDAGATDDGRPFLVMELVEGDPITAACDEQRLPVRARLELFLAVCAAVQSAHQHLVVHLDLKPSNILITSERRPKLLDFGTAKLTGPDVGLTVTEPLTLQYASPERLRREPVSVACDVYSLGLVLYELVSGGWPFGRHESIVAVAERASGLLDATPLSRVVTEDAAHRRSTSLERLRSDLRGDLEAIVARTLAHDPAARYATVAELAADIQRYLDGELVLARTPGLGYRLGKFVTRHRWEVASVVVVILALLGAATYSTVQARAARAAAERAQAQNRFLTSLFTLAGNDATSASGMTVRELLALADQRVSPLLTSQPDVAGDVERTLAQGLLAHGALDDAEALAARARGRAADLGDAPREAAARALLSYLRYARSRPAEAMDEARAALRMWREHRASFDADLEAYTLMTASSTLAYANPPSAEPSEYLEACLARTDDTATAMRYTVRQGCLFLLAAVRVNAEERFADAEILLIEAVALQRADPTLRSQLVNSLQLLGIVQRVTGRFVEDEATQREAYEILARLQGADSTAALWQRAVWATSLVGAGRAEDGYREAMVVLDQARRRYPARGTNLLWTPLSAASIAACYLERLDECGALSVEALETLGPDPPPNDARARTARGLLGLALAHRGRFDEARPMIQAAVDGTLKSRRTSIFMARWQAALASGAK